MTLGTTSTEAHLDTIRRLSARRRCSWPVEREDMEAEAALALVRLMRRNSDPSPGLVSTRLKGAMQDYIRQQTGWRHDYMRPAGALVEEPGMSDPEPSDFWAWLKARLNDERLYAVLHLRYVEGLAQSEIGVRIGRAQARVSQLHAQALDAVRELLTSGE